MARGLLPQEFADRELWDLSIWAWDLFLRANGDPALHRLADVDGPRIFPHPEGALPDRYGGADLDLAEYVERGGRACPSCWRSRRSADGMRGLERGGERRPRGAARCARPRRGRVPGRRGRGPGGRGHEPGVGRSRLAQRHVGRERQPGGPAPRHPHGHRADGADGRHRHADRAHDRGPRVRRPAPARDRGGDGGRGRDRAARPTPGPRRCDAGIGLGWMRSQAARRILGSRWIGSTRSASSATPRANRVRSHAARTQADERWEGRARSVRAR